MVDIARIQIEADSRSVRTAGKDLNSLDKQGRTTQAGMNLLKTAMVALGGALSVQQVIRYADSWQNLTNQLKVVQKDGENLASTQKTLIKTANDTRSSFDATATLYARLSRASADLGLNQNDLIGITKTINQAFAVSGATAQEASNAIVQLSQGLAAGALRGEEFNSVAEQAPILMDALGTALNMTRGELRDFAAEGGITAEIVINSLTAAADGIDESFSKMTATFGQNMTVAQNNLLEFVGSAEAIQGATGIAGSALVKLSENFDTLVDIGTVAGIVFGARMVSSLSASSVAFVSSLAPVAKYNSALMITQKSSLAASVAQGAMAASTKVASAAFSLIGGPMGALVITGAALYAMWNRNNEAMGTFTAVIGRTREAIDQAKMSGGSLDVQIAAVERGIVDLSAELANTNFLFGENSRESRELQQELALQRGRLNTLSREQAAHNLLVAKGTEGSAAFVGPIRQVTEAVENNTGALGENSDALEENYSASVNVFKALAEEMHQLNMTARERAIYNNVIQAGIDASPEEIAAITAATNALFDQRDAIDDAKEATEWWTSAATNGARQRSEAERIAGEEMRESQARTHEFITGTLIDIYESGGSAFDKLADSFKAMIKRMVAEWAASKLMNLFGMDGGGSNPFAGISLGGGGGGGGGTGGGFDITKLLGGGGQSNPLGSLLDRYTGKIRQNTGYNDIVNGLGFGDKAVQGGADWSTGMPEATGGEFNADQLTAGLKQAGITMVASAGGGYLGNEAGESWTGKRANSNIAQTAGSVIGSIFGPWGTFAGSTIGGFVDSAFGSGSPSSNAGIYLDPNAGAGNDRFFDIERFASGFQAQGFARREDEGEARKIASIFGTADFAFTEAVKELGGMIDISGANMALKGYSIDGGEFGGGSFMGYSSERGEGVKSMSMDEQLSRYIEQLADNVHGIDEELLAALKAAGSAEQAFQLLSDAVDKAAVEAESAHEEAAKTATEETEKQVESLTSFERAQKRASESVMAAYASGLTELDAVDRAFKTFQLYAERGLTSSAIARFTGELQSDIDAVLNRGRALGNAGDAANDSSVAANDSSVTGSRRTKSDVISDILGLSTGTIDVGGSSLLRFSGSNLGFTESQLRGGDKATINDVARRLGIDGSHANGLPRVPFDGYRAELHRNEEVLTASDPRNRNNGGGSMADLRAELRAIAHQTKRTSDILLRVTRDGNALMTEAVA